MKNTKLNNSDVKTIHSFSDEWSKFDQSKLPDKEAHKIFEEYFSIFPWEQLSKSSQGFDMGCGSGRWAKIVAPKVGHLHCIDPSSAIMIAKKNLNLIPNVTFYNSSADEVVLPLESQDFGYSLGVLHHIPDTEKGMRSCVAYLKPNAPFLVYLYYSFDNRSLLYRFIWRLSDILRQVIHRMPSPIKIFFTDLFAFFIYYPLAKISYLLEYFNFSFDFIPLSYYRNHSFYTMRTDSRDRFGTPLEKRFSKIEIENMLKKVGLRDIIFSDKAPYWCAIGYKK